MSLIILSIPVFFLLIAIELLVQYFSGRKIYRTNDALTNISCGITQQLSGLVFKVFSFGAYLAVYEYARFYTIETTWYTWILLLLGVDFFYYWAHRMSHEINLFWGGHVVHHQSEDYNFSVALRQSSFQVIWTFGFYLPLAVAGFDPVDFLTVNAITTLYQFWIHTETIGKLGPLEWVFNTPSHHRVHHGRDPKYIDRNHAGMFIIWDKMFGTFQVEEERPVYGITQPVNSWNPVWVNLAHYHIMWKELRKIRGFRNKLLYLVKKPGWLPEELGGYRAPQQVNKSEYVKYDMKPIRRMREYVIIQFLLVLGITSLYLFNLNNLGELYGWVVGLWITGSVVALGGLLEIRRWAISGEILRQLFSLFACIYGITSLEISLWLPAIIGILSLISVIVLLMLNHEKQKLAV